MYYYNVTDHKIMRHFSRLKSKNLESEGDDTFEFKRNVET